MAASQLPSTQDGKQAKGCEAAVNRQIHLHLYASYSYLSIAHYFDRPDLALKHFSNFFHHLSKKERKQAVTIMEMQNKRGADIRFWDILKPGHECKWEDGLKAMEYALSMENRIYQSLLDLLKLATDLDDRHLCNFLQSDFLNEQGKYVKEVGDHVANLRRMKSDNISLSQYLFENCTSCGTSKE
ncbi:ferritin heavy chain-like [Suncus etruscus]|uniref:ferritin heavy chain-like n=1 Tax=Suncus etruscus TaxID=109475 RepID=UPI0021102812|nr:ferritin heavy chain-like [Suncus etruscus]